MARLRNWIGLSGANTQLAADNVEFFASTDYRQFLVDFSLFGGSSLYCSVSAISRDATANAVCNVRVGGTAATADGTIIATFTANQAPFTDTSYSGDGSMTLPTGISLVKISWTSTVSAALKSWVIYMHSST